MHYNSVAFSFSHVSGSSNKKTGFSLFPHTSFSVLMKSSNRKKSQTDVIIQKCRSKVSLDSYAEKYVKERPNHNTFNYLLHTKQNKIKKDT